MKNALLLLIVLFGCEAGERKTTMQEAVDIAVKELNRCHQAERENQAAIDDATKIINQCTSIIVAVNAQHRREKRTKGPTFNHQLVGGMWTKIPMSEYFGPPNRAPHHNLFDCQVENVVRGLGIRCFDSSEEEGFLSICGMPGAECPSTGTNVEVQLQNDLLPLDHEEVKMLPSRVFEEVHGR